MPTFAFLSVEWFNTTVYSPEQLIMALVGSVCWILVYAIIIRNAHRYRTVEMPFLIGYGNFAWELLYSWVFDSYINMGTLFLWGYRAWFFLDIYIIYLFFRYGNKQVQSETLKQHFRLMSVLLIAAALGTIYSLVVSGFDNTPIHGDGSVRLGGTSAYLLNIGISVLYLLQYGHKRGKEHFSVWIAWLKMIGTALFTVFFIQIDPQNYFLLTLAGLVFALDLTYIVWIQKDTIARREALSGSLQESWQKFRLAQKTRSLRSLIPTNSTFDELWTTASEEQKQMYSVNGIELRTLTRKEWTFNSLVGDFVSSYRLAEGVIIIQESKGKSATGADVRGTNKVLIDILEEFSLFGKPAILLTKTSVAGGDLEARRETIDLFTDPRLAELETYVVTKSRFVRAGIKLNEAFNPSAMKRWYVFTDEAVAFQHVINFFTKSSTALNKSAKTYHEERVQQMFGMLTKISDNRLDEIMPPTIPDDDLYFDVFNSVNIVLEDKRNQMQELEGTIKQLSESNEEIMRQQEILEEQAHDIELSNTKLQEQYAVIERERLELETINQELDAERERSETLLLNIMPMSIARRLRAGEGRIADHFQSISVMFVDLVGFTTLAQSLSAQELVALLDEIFSLFDGVIEKYKLEKVKTIGDAYMVVGGLPEISDDHCFRMAEAALELSQLIEEKREYFKRGEHYIEARFGIHTGEAIAGVIGKRKLAYDIWGDSVNTASRMESHGIPGRIHCSEDFHNVLKDFFTFEERGQLSVKGKGNMNTYFLRGRK